MTVDHDALRSIAASVAFPNRGSSTRWGDAYGRPKPMPSAATEPDLSWFSRAACRGMGPNAFYPETRAESVVARAICKNNCPVREECLRYALDTNETLGVWGGTSGMERRRMRHEAIVPTANTWNEDAPGASLLRLLMEVEDETRDHRSQQQQQG